MWFLDILLILTFTAQSTASTQALWTRMQCSAEVPKRCASASRLRGESRHSSSARALWVRMSVVMAGYGISAPCFAV